MSEEIENAAVNVPRCMTVSIVLNGVLGFGMLLAVLFCLGDIEKVTSTPPIQYPFMAIFLQATDSVSGSTAMAALVIVLSLCATIAFVATSSRMYWSFARDRGLPFANYLSKVCLEFLFDYYNSERGIHRSTRAPQSLCSQYFSQVP